MNRIGYACLTVGVPGTGQGTCIQKNADNDRLLALIEGNLEALDLILDYNIENGIKMFRISSDIIPFGSSPVNKLPWWDLFEGRFKEMGNKAVGFGMRLSMHPGQYTVLNSPDPDVVRRAVEDLRYHTRFLDALGLDRTHKIILHIGGAYGDKPSAMARFEAVYKTLDEEIRRRLIIENDDRIYNVAEVLAIGEKLGIPAVFDNLHHQVNPNSEKWDEIACIDRCRLTWSVADGDQKIHYSQQDPQKRQGSHSATVDLSVFMEFYNRLADRGVDIMLEVKDKNLSAVKCNLSVTAYPSIKRLEKEWGRYKYTVLEHEPNIYKAIRALLKDKSAYPVLEFYNLVQLAMETPVTIGNGVNGAQHVWGYFKERATQKELAQFLKAIDGYKQGSVSLNTIKRQLLRLTQKYGQPYLKESLYFDL